MTRRTRYVVLGNGAAGTSAAERLRQNDPDASITVVAAESHPLYSRVALPRYVRGQIPEAQVFLRSFEDYERQDIALLSGVKADSIDPAGRTVLCGNGRSLRFDKLLIATGGRPRPSPWQIPGDRRTSITFQTLEDAREIIALGQSDAHVLVVGGGFIGYELAEAIAYRKSARVTWLIRRSHFLADVFDRKAADICGTLAAEAGVEIIANDAVESVASAAAGYRVTTRAGKSLQVDAIAQGIGVDCHTEPARTAALPLEIGIRTDSRLRTQIEGIFAAGDIADFLDERTGRRTRTGAWDSAVAQGRLAADNMTGADRPFAEVEAYTTSLFGSTLAVIGDARSDHPANETLILEGTGYNYRRFHFADGKLTGALMIGSPRGRKRIIELIRDEVPIPEKAETLPEFAAV